MPKVTMTVFKVRMVVRKVRRKKERIIVTVERINQVREQIEQARGRMDEIRERINTLRTAPLTAEWRETAEGAIFVERLQRANDDFRALVDVIRRLTTVLGDSASRFQQTQQAIRDRAADLIAANPRR